MKRNLQNSNGFTLFEMVIVLCVISVLAFASAPSVLKWLPNFKLRSAAGELFSDMQLAKLNAVKSNREWGIQFDTVGNLYQIIDSTDGTWSNADDRIVKTVSLNSFGGGVQFGFGNADVDIEGNATPADTVTFTSDMTVYNARGMANEAGHIYLENKSDLSYGLGNNISAFIFMRKWMGGNWE